MTGVNKKDTVEISEILAGDFEGKTVKVNGAVHTIRDMGEVAFVILRKREGLLQCVFEEGKTKFDLKDLKEAAKIDGCNESQTTRYIVLPLMRASFTICMFLTITRCFMIYDVNLSLTEGGPYGSTVMAAMYVFQKAFSAKQYGVGQTEAIILFIFTAVIAVSQTIINKRKEVEA